MFLKSINSVRGGHCYYVLERQNVFTPPVSRTFLRALPLTLFFAIPPVLYFFVSFSEAGARSQTVTRGHLVASNTVLLFPAH